MIKYNLKCENNHEFESWFSNSEEFDKLNKKKLLECIYCTSKKIEKSIMSPSISNKSSKNINPLKVDQKLINERDKLMKLRNIIEKNFEFVGDKLSKKVREVYYDKNHNKAIYGTATTEEKEELADEGIDLISVPWVSKDN